MKKLSDEHKRAATGDLASLQSGSAPAQGGDGSPIPLPARRTGKGKDGDAPDQKDTPETDPTRLDAEADVPVPEEVLILAGETTLGAPDAAVAPAAVAKEECSKDSDDDDCDDKGGWLWWTGAGVGFAAAGVGIVVGKGSSGTVTDGSAVAFSGRVTDGPVHGATIYNDVNKNGVYDNGVDKLMIHGGQAIMTDADGHFIITVADLAENGIPDINRLKLVAYGGIDTVTGEAVTVDFTAPEGYRFLNPITSLIAAYMEAHNDANPGALITAAQAEAAVVQALGLPQLNYATTDLALPETAVEAQKAAAVFAVAALLIEESGTDSDGFAYLAANLSPPANPASGATTYLVEQVTSALQSVAERTGDTTPVSQFTSTVIAVNAADTLESINNSLNSTIFADLIVTGTVKVGQILDGALGVGSTLV